MYLFALFDKISTSTINPRLLLLQQESLSPVESHELAIPFPAPSHTHRLSLSLPLPPRLEHTPVETANAAICQGRVQNPFKLKLSCIRKGINIEQGGCFCGGKGYVQGIEQSVCVCVCVCVCAFANFQLELNSNLVQPAQPRPLGNKLYRFFSRSPSAFSLSLPPFLWFIFCFFIVTELSAQFSQKFRERWVSGGLGGVERSPAIVSYANLRKLNKIFAKQKNKFRFSVFAVRNLCIELKLLSGCYCSCCKRLQWGSEISAMHPVAKGKRWE